MTENGDATKQNKRRRHSRFLAGLKMSVLITNGWLIHGSDNLVFAVRFVASLVSPFFGRAPWVLSRQKAEAAPGAAGVHETSHGVLCSKRGQRQLRTVDERVIPYGLVSDKV